MADVGAGMSIMESVGEMRRRSEHVLSTCGDVKGKGDVEQRDFG